MSVSVEAHELGKDWGDLVALYPTNILVETGDLIALVGHNGAGKTTLLSLLAGVLEATSGSAIVCGNPSGSLQARKDLSYISDYPVFYDDLSLIEHIEYVARLHNAPWEKRAEELLTRLSLQHRADDLPQKFSRGLKQRASIILGLIRPSRVLLADEPTTALDTRSRLEVLSLLDEARKKGSAVVVSSHQPELLEYANRCVALREGKKVYDGSMEAADVADLMS